MHHVDVISTGTMLMHSTSWDWYSNYQEQKLLKPAQKRMRSMHPLWQLLRVARKCFNVDERAIMMQPLGGDHKLAETS